MAFRDDVRRNLANAPGAVTRAKQERFQRDVDGVCDTIKKLILSLSREHTNPRIPFRVELCVVARPQWAFKSRLIEQRNPGWFNNTRSISEMIVSDEMMALRKAVKSQLARDGIQVGEWLLCDNYLSDDGDYNITYLESIRLNKMGQSQLKLLNINPNTTFRCRDYQTIGATSPRYHTEFTQGNARYNYSAGSDPRLVFVVKYQ